MDWQSAAGKALKEKWSTERTGRSNPKLLGRTGPGRTKPGPAIESWRFVRELTMGSTAVEAATTFRLEEQRTVSNRAAQYHLIGSACLYDQGLPFDHKALTVIREAAGFHQAPFEQTARLPHRAATTPKKGEGSRSVGIARLVVAWRDHVIKAMCQAKGDRNRGYHNNEVIITLLPDLESLVDALVETFGGKQVGRYAKPGGIQAELIAHPDWTIENVWHFTAENARLYGRGSPWFRTACVLHELEDILKPRLDALRNADSVTGFVFEVLGIRYGTDPKEHHVLNAHGSIPPDRIKRAIQHRHPIPPKEMLGLVQTALKEVPLPKLRGSESGPREDTQKKIRMAAALLKVHGETINWSEQISRFGCSEQEMYTFRSRYRAKIRFAAETMTLDEAAALWGANQ